LDNKQQQIANNVSRLHFKTIYQGRECVNFIKFNIDYWYV